MYENTKNISKTKEEEQKKNDTLKMKQNTNGARRSQRKDYFVLLKKQNVGNADLWKAYIRSHEGQIGARLEEATQTKEGAGLRTARRRRGTLLKTYGALRTKRVPRNKYGLKNLR